MFADVKIIRDEVQEREHINVLIKVHRVENSGKTIRLVELRKISGHHDWTGDWSVKSEIWTRDLKR
jgi:hypothetical protein